MDPWHHFDRREFLRRSALLLPAFHGALLASAATAQASDIPGPVVELRELTLRTDRPAELAVFYREVLNLPVTEGSEVVVEAGKTRLRFLSVDDGSKPFYHFAFTIPENKLEGAIEWMKSRCPLLDQGSGPVVDFKAWNAHSVYFYDPAGNILEFIAHHGLRNGMGGAFSSKDILYASEIGLVVPKVGPVVDDLAEHLGLGVYVKSWKNFAPIGDIHGLFIVVKSDRIWLMTDDPGKIFPADVVLASPRTEELRFGDLPYRISS
jgi:catechol 2,3-dioxygenase-like lactoylglutathione lyase family enzyme